MLNPHPQRKWLAFHGQPCIHHPLEHVPSAVACRQNHAMRQNFTRAGADPCDSPCFGLNQAVHPGAEPNLPSAFPDPVAHRLDDARQFVRANVGVGVNENVLVRSVLHKPSEGLEPSPSFFGPGVQLPVGVSARSSFAKAVIGFRVYMALTNERDKVPPSFANGFSSLQNDGLDAKFDQSQRAKQPCWARSNHDHFGSLVNRPPLTNQHRRTGNVQSDFHLDGRRMAPCIQAPAQNAPVMKVRCLASNRTFDGLAIFRFSGRHANQNRSNAIPQRRICALVHLSGKIRCP